MKKITAIALVAFLLLSSANAKAELIEITATPTNSLLSGFSLIFDDANGDGLLSLSEVISFSGISAFGNVYSFFAQSPDLLGLSLFETTAGFFGSNLTGSWGFCVDANCNGSLTVSRGGFLYSVSRVSVPEPGTLALLGLGLAAIGFSRRRRNRA